jgi:DNA-binding LacI/PurR family transcriptional regulator
LKSKNPTRNRSGALLSQKPSLKDLARYLNLSPTTVSLVLNRSRLADSIPPETKRRIFKAAKMLGYRANFVARSLRAQRSYTIGVIVPEISEGYEAMVLSGIEDHLLREGYFYFVVSHRHKPELIARYIELLLERAIEGLIAVDTPCNEAYSVPVVAVSSHEDREGVTNIILDHDRAAMLAVDHLLGLGHRKMAVIKGQSFSSDTEARWAAIREAMRARGLQLDEALTAQLKGNTPSPHVGYVATKKLLSTNKPFTALVAFNDVSAIGAIRALREAGRRVPEDVSVVGFDDIQSAEFQRPALTTVHQPLHKMGILAAKTVLYRIANGAEGSFPKILTVEPRLVVRETTGPAPRGLATVNIRLPSA